MTDTSKDTVENLAARLSTEGRVYTCTLAGATLRALVAERDALREQLSAAETTIVGLQAQAARLLHDDPVYDASVSAAAKVLLGAMPNPIFDNLKYPMIGEFSWSREVFDENGDEVTEKLVVPWVTCKEILEFAVRSLAKEDSP